jgi:hypothetical protein
MSRPSDEELRAAFQALGDDAPVEGVDTELVWRAVSGELPPEQRREVVERVARDPSWAMAWRMAHEVRHGLETPRPGRLLAWSAGVRYGALAAALVATIGAGLWLRTPTPPPAYRDGAAARIESRLPEDKALPRQDFVLRWAGPAGATYTLRITSEDLLRAYTATELKHAEYRVPPEFLIAFPAGAKLLWRVEGRMPDGTVVAGATFVARLE